MQEYSIGGCPEMGELMAASVGLGQEYNALIRQLSVCSNAIIAGLDGSKYFSANCDFYKSFNIKIGQKQTAEVYAAQLKYVLPYAVQSWIIGEPLQLHFIQNPPQFYWTYQQKQDAIYRIAAAQIKIGNYIKRYLRECFAQRQSEWIISLQINYALGEIIIPKYE